MKIFCMVVLCACLFIACEKDNDDYEPVKPPVEQPENPVEPEKPDEPEKPEKPAIPPSTDNIINFKIGDLNMIVGSYMWYHVVYGNGIYVASSHWNAEYISTSADGVTWSEPVQINKSSYYKKLRFLNGKFYMVGLNGYVISSVDGINWTEPIVVGDGTIKWFDITYANGKYVIVGDTDKYARGEVSTSPDGINWTKPVKAGDNGLFSIAYGNGMFVASGDRNTVVSTDGVTWTKIANSLGYVECIAYGNGYFILGNNEGRLYKFIDLNNYSRVFTESSIDWYDIAYGNNMFIVVGGYGYLTTSRDGENWTDVKQLKNESGEPVNELLRGVCIMSN